MLTLLKEMGVPYEERPVSLDEILAADTAGTLHEAFGIGTAAIIAPIASIGYREREIKIPTGAAEGVAKKLHSKLVAIQTGREADTHNWLVTI